MEIKELTIGELERVYRRHLLAEFPQDEIAGWEHISRLQAQGRYYGWGCYQEGELVAYAFFSATAHGLHLLDFLETLPAHRGQGWGSRFLPALIERYSPQLIIIEVEDPNLAPDPQSELIRQRRLRFYERLGAYPSGLKSYLGQTPMLLLAVNGPYPEWDEERLRQEMREHYALLYGAKGRIL